MTAKTYFVAQAFVKDGRRLAAAQALQLSSADQAIARARRFPDRVVGRVAFQQVADDETGEFLEEPKLLYHAGQLPADFGV